MNGIKKAVILVVLVACATGIGISAYMLASYYNDGKKAEETFNTIRPFDNNDEEKLKEPYDSELAEKYRKLYEENNDFAAWIRIPETDVDYPVMQNIDDMEYYLKRDFYKNESSAGTLFLSEFTDIVKPSDVIIVYGHMMNNGSMFGSLKGYLKKDYYDKHKYIQLDTLSQRFNYKIVSVIITQVGTKRKSEFKYYNYSDFENENAFNGFVSGYKELEEYETGETVEYGEKFILLSTCNYTYKNARLVIIAKQVDELGDN